MTFLTVVVFKERMGWHLDSFRINYTLFYNFMLKDYNVSAILTTSLNMGVFKNEQERICIQGVLHPGRWDKL